MDFIMKHPAPTYLALPGIVFLSLLLVLPALAELPKRDLTVELRQVEEGEGRGYLSSTQSRRVLFAQQLVQVRNGETASLSMGQSMPIQWVQSASAQKATLKASGGASVRSSAGAVANAVTWMDAGQSIKVHPRWPGAKQSVTVDIEVQSSNVEVRIGTELPEPSHSQVTTTVNAPLGQWITFASTGSSPQQGVYGSEASSDTRRLLQIRVLAP